MPLPNTTIRRILAAAGAVAAAVVLVTAFVVTTGRGGDAPPERVRVGGSTSTPASTRPTPAERSVPAEPTSALLPTDVPTGLRPWNISVRRATTLPGFDQHVQLLLAGDGPGRILLSFQAASPGSKGGGSPVEVRGQAGTVMAAKEFPSSTA